MNNEITFSQFRQALEASLGRALTINAMAAEIEVPQPTLRRWSLNGIPPRAQRLVRMIVRTRNLDVVSKQDTTPSENSNETAR
jgi:hypothetical protein